MIPSGYSRSVLSGTLSNGEIFQTGFWAAEAPTSSDAAATQASAISTNFSEKLSDDGYPPAFLGTGDSWDKVTVYSYTDTSGEATFIGEADIANGGGSGTQTLPNQSACAITLLTGKSGRRNRGRMFVPITKMTLTSGQIADATVTDFATWWADFLTNCASDIGQDVVVLSQVAGSANAITQVRCDSRLDVQRRRADSEQILHQHVVDLG